MLSTLAIYDGHHTVYTPPATIVEADYQKDTGDKEVVVNTPEPEKQSPAVRRNPARNAGLPRRYDNNGMFVYLTTQKVNHLVIIMSLSLTKRLLVVF